MKNDALVTQIYEMVKPIADELNYEIYHVEYVKENGEYYLRIYIEKEGGITLSDCEALSRRVSDLMDEKDPIPEAYFLEVSSPGLNRTLFTEDHYKRFVGREVIVKLTKAIDGKKSIKGILKEANEENIIVEADTINNIPKEKIKSANIRRGNIVRRVFKMNQEFIGALKEIVKEKGISEDLLFTTIEDALVAAYKKNYAGPTSQLKM